MLKVTGRFSLYRIAVVIGSLVAIAMTLFIPAHMDQPDDQANLIRCGECPVVLM